MMVIDEKWNISHFQFQLFLFWLHHLHNHQLEEAAGQNPKRNLIQMGHGRFRRDWKSVIPSLIFSYGTWTKLKQNSHFGPIVDFETDSLPFNKDLMNFSPSLVIQRIQRLSTCSESYHTTLKEKLHFFSPHLFIFVSTHVHNVYTYIFKNQLIKH